MKKLHVISVKENDKWELDLSSYSTKTIKDRKDKLLKIYQYDHIKVNHFTMDEDQHSYKVTLGICIVDSIKVNVSSITITPDILKCLEDNFGNESELQIKYSIPNNRVTIYLSATDNKDVLNKLQSIIENVIEVITNRLSKNGKNVIDIINTK